MKFEHFYDYKFCHYESSNLVVLRIYALKEELSQYLPQYDYEYHRKNPRYTLRYIAYDYHISVASDIKYNEVCKLVHHYIRMILKFRILPTRRSFDSRQCKIRDYSYNEKAAKMDIEKFSESANGNLLKESSNIYLLQKHFKDSLCP